MPFAPRYAISLARTDEDGILAVWHYQPLHISKIGKMFGGRDGHCPVAERVAEQLVRLPFYTSMTNEEQSVVIEALCEFE